MSNLLTLDNALAFLTLLALEIVLGIDNIVLIAILTGRLPEERRAAARRLGLAMALITRILLLLTISWMVRLTDPAFTLFGRGFSGRDLILIGGGLFLIGKATFEVHENLEGPEDESATRKAAASFAGVITQIALLDIVFSLDSVITAVGMVKDVRIMIAAVVISVLVMLIFAGPVSRFIERHPTIKMLALSFMLLIGVLLVVEGFGGHVERGYVYFAMGFSLAVEMLNIRARRAKKAEPVHLRRAPVEKAAN